MADIVIHERGGVLVVAPTTSGRLGAIANQRMAVLNKGEKAELTLTRWIFADFSRASLRDEWGNTYDHLVHVLLAGDLQTGRDFVAALEQASFTLEQHEDMFVPFQRIAIHDAEDSDQLRLRHPRAWAVARRSKPRVQDLITRVREHTVLGQ